MANEEKSFQKSSINWYPGHMATIKRQIKKIINVVDITIHVVDARIPYSSYIKDINNYIKNKPQIIFMSKYDLCDKKETDKWVEYYKEKGYRVLCSNLKEDDEYLKVFSISDDIMKTLNCKRKMKGLLPKKATVMILGVPNVGKSTLINRLVNKKVSEVGNKAGVTKTINKIRIGDKLDLIDTPGILWPKIDDENIAYNLASMSIIKEEVLPLDEISVYILKMLSNYYKDIYLKMYGNVFYKEENIVDVYESISKVKNIPFYQGEADYDRINKIIINDIKSGRIKGITFDKL